MLLIALIVLAATPPALHLPSTVKPTAYAVTLDLDPEVEAFHGVARIDVSVSAPTRLIWLHGEGLAIRTAEVAGIKAKAASAKNGFMSLTLERELAAGSATIVIDYDAKQDSATSQGIYRVKEPDGKWYSYTFFQPIDARRAFPCFDEPQFKTPWTLSVRTPAGNIAAANTASTGTQVIEKGMRYDFAVSKPLPAYLVAFMVGPFEVIDAGTAGLHATPLRFILPQGRSSELRYAKEVSSRIVGMLETWFAIPYPFGKLDIAVTPRQWGTMEHPGLVAMGQPLTLIKPNEETLDRKRDYANILIHELGHYWFGDYVTMKWWDDTWINEGTATWFDRKITAAFEPTWHYDQVQQEDRVIAMQRDTTLSAKALRQPVLTTNEIEGSFDNALTYQKGAAVLLMFERWLGDTKLQAAVRSYMKSHAWGNATSDDLIRAVSNEVGRDVAPAMKSFVEQAGVPLVSMSLECRAEASVLHLRQQRTPSGSTSSGTAPRKQSWTVPVCVRFGAADAAAKSFEKCDLLSTESADWTLSTSPAPCPAWVAGNAGSVGYYLVSYDDAARAALARHFTTKLSPEERLGYVNDSTLLNNTGVLDVSDLLQIGVANADDPNPLVARSARGAVEGQINPRELPAELSPHYKQLILALYGKDAHRLGWAEKAGESAEDHDMRQQVVPTVAVWGEDASLQEEARRLALRWLQDREGVAPDIAGAVLRVAARHGDRALYDAYLAEARRTTSREDRSKIFYALSRFADPALVALTQKLAESDEFDIRESEPLFYAGLSERATREHAWRFFKAHFDHMSAKLRDDEKSWILSVVERFCDRPHRQDAATFFTPRAAKISGGARILANHLEGVDQCIARREKNEARITAFLKKY